VTRNDAAAIAPWAAAAALAALYLAAFWPGALGFDAAYQWWQARGGETTNIHGIGMTWLWRLGESAGGPGSVFAAEIALWFAALALCARAVPLGALAGYTSVLGIALAPVCAVLFFGVSSDAWLVGVLTLAVALALAPAPWARARSVAIVLLLLAALLLRKNALPAVVPLLVLAVQRGTAWPWRRLWLPAAAVGAGLFALAALAERNVDRRVDVLPATALWDLAAVSLADRVLLLPPASHGPGLDLDDLAQAFEPYANAPLFARTRAGIVQPFLQPDSALDAAVTAAWRDAIAQHPRAWLAHRARVSAALFGAKAPDWPHELVYLDGVVAYADNPPLAPNRSALHAAAIALCQATFAGVLFAAWPYLALALIACVVAWRRRAAPRAQVALAVLASGLCYAAPLPLIAPSAELRYLGWTCAAALLGALVAATSRMAEKMH